MIHLTFLLISFFLVACAPQAKLTVQSPAEIDSSNIRNVAVGKFEIGGIRYKVKTERKGKWTTHYIRMSSEKKQTISRTVRSRVVNLLTATPYFKVVFSDEFQKLENDSALQQLISSRGYKVSDVDAVLNGKLWIEVERIDGVDMSKESLEYVNPPRSRRDSGLNLSVDQMVWWPYKSMRGTLGLELKLTRLVPTEVVASTFDSRTYAHRIGGKTELDLQQISQNVTEFIRLSSDEKSDPLDASLKVLPALEQVIADLSVSIAANFVRRVMATEKTVAYPVADGKSVNSKVLIEAGAYDYAIDQLQQDTAENPHPGDLYNLGLCFEAIGDYGLALTFYREAWNMNRNNLLFAQGLGRIEKMKREHPRLQQQLASRKQ